MKTSVVQGILIHRQRWFWDKRYGSVAALRADGPKGKRGESVSQEKADQTVMPPLGFDAYKVLLPSICGLALSSTVVNVCIQVAHATTGTSTFSGFTMFISAVIISVLFLSTLVVKRFNKRFISSTTFGAILLAGLCSLVSAVFDGIGFAPSPLLALMLGVGITVGSTYLEFYWLRKLRGVSAQAAAIVVFAALALSETATFMMSFSSELTWHVAGAVLTFIQMIAIKISRTMDAPSDTFPAVSESYFGTDENRFSNRSFLVVAAVGIWFISIPIGMGRGFPAGDPIYMSTVPRFLIMIFVWVVSALWVRNGLKSRMRALTTSIWVVMEILIALGAIFFAIWPKTISIGASFVMAASLVLSAFIWYLTIAFISFGWRDSFYYASAAWVASNMLTVAGMKFDTAITRVMPNNAPVIISIMSFFVLVATQVVFTKLLAAPSEQTESGRAEGPITEDDVRKIPLMGVLAISPQAQAPMVNQKPSVHIATSVVEMGQRFGLTGREVEVLTLYALGHTQARVSEELQLSPNTVHTHIKRIYDKTDLHSRQEILDYIAEYGSQGT